MNNTNDNQTITEKISPISKDLVKYFGQPEIDLLEYKKWSFSSFEINITTHKSNDDKAQNLYLTYILKDYKKEAEKDFQDFLEP